MKNILRSSHPNIASNNNLHISEKLKQNKNHITNAVPAKHIHTRHTKTAGARIARLIALYLALVMSVAVFFTFGYDYASVNIVAENESPAEGAAHDCCHAGGSFKNPGDHHGHGYKNMVYYVLHIYRGQTLENILPPAPMQSGNGFMHWSRQPDGAPFDFSRPIMDDTTFYAIWGLEANDFYHPPGGGISHAPYYGSEDERYQAQGYGYAYNLYAAPSGYIAQAPGYIYYEVEYYQGNNYAYSYDYGYAYNYYGSCHNYGYETEPELPYYDYEGHYYGDTPAYGDIITVTFLWNHGGYWPDYDLYNHTGKLNIHIDNRANITVYPEIRYSILLDGEYFQIRFPMEIDADDISISMDNSNWTYAINHLQEYNVSFEAGLDGDVSRVYESQNYTVVTLSHDIQETHPQPSEVVYLQVDEPGARSYGFAPFAFGAPFTMVTLAPPFDFVAWSAALGPTTENRVVVIPQDLDVLTPFGLNITGNRHVIITSYGTNLNNSTSNHTAPPEVFTLTLVVMTSIRHFTVGTGATLSLSHITLDGNEREIGGSRGGVTLNNGGSLHMLDGSTIQHCSGGAVDVNGNTGAFTMSGNSRVYRNTSISWLAGAGVIIRGARTLSMYDTASVSHNHNMTSSAGVALFAAGAHVIMNDNSSISHNTSSTTGAGIHIGSNGAMLTMNGGSISNNSVHASNEGAPIGRGGGVAISGADSVFTFNAGVMHSNHASARGGAIFASESVHSSILPMGAYPQLIIAPEASFFNNTTGIGGFAPPTNALAATNIQTTQASGGFNHPINNLDINFANIEADWFRLNAAINATSATNIVIHPADTTGVTAGLVGSTYNLIISDPSDDGNVITTLDMSGSGSTDHYINVARPVTVQAADGANIILRMPVPSAVNTPNVAPWITQSVALSRHFMVDEGGNLTLNGIGTGTLTLDGNADLVTANRGGITIGAFTGPGSATLGSGAVVTNNRTFNGGGVHIQFHGHLVIDGGVISHNFATTNGGGVNLSTATTTLNFISGQIINNTAVQNGGGVFASVFTSADPLPAGSYPQLTVGSAAIFSGNMASGSNAPPANAASATQIQATAQVSGGFSHPLNNLDINFRFGDWIRLNYVIQALPNPATVVIHPAGASVTAGLTGSTYNFVISPGNGSTISTMNIVGAPPNNIHRIAIANRTITIGAAPGANIVLEVPPATEMEVGRHFLLTAAGGHLILGGGAGSGTLTLNGNADNLPGNRGGVGVNFAANTQLTLQVGSVITNSRAINGGAVAHSANTRLNMNGGTITGNIATGNGGGVFLVASPLSRVYFNSGTISNNTAMIGGGIFSGTYSYLDPLPAGAFPQLIISTDAIFYGNNATTGGMTPPGNAGPPTTAITNADSRSGGFAHPLNNLDINFARDEYVDWLRLNRIINNMTPAPHTITIHPHGTGVVEGPVGAPGTYYNFVISNPVATNYIYTLPIGTGTNNTIAVSRTVTIRPADGHDIVISMATSGANHFTVSGSGNLTIGGSTGTISITANWTDRTAAVANRGGINVTGTGVLNLQSGAILRENSTTGVGGGARVESNTGTINMYDGAYVINNIAGNGGGGLGFTTSTLFNAVINIYGGTISDNVAPWAGGIWAQSGTVNMHSGNITNNNAGLIGTQAPNAGALDGLIDNPHGAGGGVRICCRGSFIMHDGVIANNTARYGGGVLISHGTTPVDPITSLFVMYGGSIVDNTATLTYVNPNNQRPGWVHNADGGGIFIMSSGQFVMRDHPNNIPINISRNTADQHGGGVYYQVGQWDTNERRQPVTMEDNEAIEDGGAIFLSYRTLGMYGEWRLGYNTANRGGGVFLHGDASPHTYIIGTGWVPHPLMGDGRLIMHDSTVRIHDNHSHTSGGGVYIYQDATLEMRAGSIDNNTSNIFGGGVYVLNPGMYFTSRFVATGGQVTDNEARYGGGVYLMFRAVLEASNVLFANNTAERMGGAIFTELIDYGNWLSGVPVPPELFPSPPDPSEILYAFENLIIEDTVEFAGNTAIAPFLSPYNAIDMLPNIQWKDWNTAPHDYLSIHIHPLNNYDINFIRPVYFYKTDMGIYETPRSINNLEGAVFRLYRRLSEISPGVYDWEYYTSATSEINGRVALLVFTPGVYRLVEHAPPTGLFTLPPGHWYVEMDFKDFEIQTIGTPNITYQLMTVVVPPPVPCGCCGTTFIEVPPIQPCCCNGEFVFMNLDRVTAGVTGDAGTTMERMRWHVGNAPPRAAMHLHKAGEGIFGIFPPPTTVSQLDNMLREGAVFALYRYTGNGTPADTLAPAPGWVRTNGFHTSTGDPNQPIELMLVLREDQPFSYYQIVELIPPVGYMLPFGQWRVRMDIVHLPTNEVTIAVSTQGNPSTPEFVRLLGEAGYTFAVGNRLSLDLPLTGGFGSISTPIIAAGASMVFVGLGAAAYLVLAKKHKCRMFI